MPSNGTPNSTTEQVNEKQLDLGKRNAVSEIYIREARSNTEPKQILLSVSLNIFQILKT